MNSSDTRNEPWWAGEAAIPLTAVPQHLPPRANGRPVSVGSIYRWSTVGAHEIRLRRFRTGPRGWCTTREELQRFAHAMTAMSGEPSE